jgi:hypothetical protein
VTNRKITRLSLDTGEPVEPDPVFVPQFEVVGDTTHRFGEPGEIRLGPPTDGVWATYYADRSAFLVFGDELAALRHAVAHHMEVTWLPFGIDLTDWVSRPTETP